MVSEVTSLEKSNINNSNAQVLAYKAYRKYQMRCFDAKQEYERELEKIKGYFYRPVENYSI